MQPFSFFFSTAIDHNTKSLKRTLPMAPKVKHLAQKHVGSPPNLPKCQKPSFSANFRTSMAQTCFEDTFAH